MSRNREAAAADWDDGPPGAEADYGYPPQPAYYPRGASGDRHYECDSRHAAYEPAPRSGGYRPASSDARYRPPPPPPPRDADSSGRYQRGDEPDHVRPRRARSRSSSASECSPRARRRRRTSSSSSSDSAERLPRRRRDSDTQRETSKRNTKSHHCDKSDYQSNKTVVSSNELSGNRDRNNKQMTSNTSHKHRERSITPPKSYKRRTTSSSSSGTSSSDSRSVSRSLSRSRRTRSRTPSRAQSRTPSIERSRTRSRTPSKGRRSRSRSSSESSGSRGHTPSPRRHTPSPRRHTPSPRRHSDSSSSSRGCFSGYDRKRYFRKLKEQQAKGLLKQQSDEKTEEKACIAPAGAVRPDSEDVARLEYGDPPPVDGVNFEDLPPPPAALCGRAPARKLPPVIPNDGSFLEMFKRMQEESQRAAGTLDAVPASSTVVKKPVLPLIGKRRGGRVLKTGLVKKVKAPQEPADNAPKDAWSLYMQEVKKYRETSCEEERKTRPLVK